MTALVALLGGFRATGFACLLLIVSGWFAVHAKVQAHRVASAQEQEAALRTQLAAADDRVEAFRMLLGQVNAEADRQIAEAKKQANAGALAASTAKAEADRLAARLASTQDALQAAKADPDCADQLKVKLCAAIPLL